MVNSDIDNVEPLLSTTRDISSLFNCVSTNRCNEFLHFVEHTNTCLLM